MIGVASPSAIVSGDGVRVSFDNDPVAVISGITTITNQHRNTTVAGLDLPSFAFHGFNYYMGTKVETNDHGTTKQVSTTQAYHAISGGILSMIEQHNYTPSQWKKSKEFGCECGKRIYVKHKYDSSLDNNMTDIDVVAFDEILKLYPIGGRYYKGSYEGDSIEDYTQEQEGELCMELLDIDKHAVDEFLGKVEEINPNSGVVEISLNWDNEEVDLDLNVAWGAGSVDIKDICDPFEHFYIKSEATIYPGTFAVSIMPKDSSAEIFDDPSIYPFTVDLVTRTPGASDSMSFTIKSKSDIRLGHVSNIKVYREDDDTNDEDGDGDTSSSSAFFIAPTIAPSCPPVQHTPSISPPRAIYFSSGSSGGYSYYSGGGGGSGGSGGSGGYAAQSDPRCSGDLECIGGATDFSNNANNTSSTDMRAPSSPATGGQPLRDLMEEDTCEGDLSCKCIPCEYEIIPLYQQVNFGPIRGADFSIYTLDGYRTQSSLYDGVTSYGETLYNAGEIEIPQGILETLDDETLYIIKAQGGEDIDRDDNFVIDTTPTKNLGKAYALIKGEDIKNTGFKINILTTVTFTLLEDMIQKDATAQQLEEKIKEIASRLLRYKIYPQSEELNISNEDLIAWLPTIDKDLLLQSYEPLDAMVEKIYANESIYEEAYKYVYLKKTTDTNTTQTVMDDSKTPIIKTFVTTIPEDTQGGTTLGSIEVLRGSEDIVFESLSGKGNELFSINTNGEIKLKEDAKLDYETKWLYKLKAEATNKNGSSGKVAVYISVKDIVDAPIFVSYEGEQISEDAKPGDIVGKINFDKGAAPITAIEMQGESTDLFDVTIDGTITVAQGASFDYENKYSYGFVVIAKNSYGNSMPAIVYINIDDVADSPKVTDYKGGYIHEDATSGSVVGEVIFDKGGAEIDSITLEGAGSQNFSVDIDGIVRVAPNAALDYESYNFYLLTVHLSNTYGTASQNIFVSVVDTLDVPSFVSFSGGNVKENSAVNTVVGQIVFDSGSVPIESISLLGDSGGAFKILDNGMILVAKNILDYEQKNHYVLQATATNAFGTSQTVEVHLFVDDVVEQAADLEDFVVNDIAEDIAIDTTLGKIELLSTGSSEIYEYEIIGEKKEYFSVDAQGLVRTKKVLDFEKDPEYKLKVKARNEAGWSYAVNLIVRLIDIPDIKPSFSVSSIYFDVFENEYNIGSIDFDAGDTPLTSFTLSGIESEKFNLDLNGILSLKPGQVLDFDRGKKYFELSATATNMAGEHSIAIEVNVLNIHDIPEVYDLNLSNVFANMPIKSIIGSINFHKGDSPITHVELNGNDPHYFDVDTNGTVRIKSLLEAFELKKDYSFNVVFVNNSGKSLQKNIDIKITGEGGIPLLNELSVNENTPIGSIIGQVTDDFQQNKSYIIDDFVTQEYFFINDIGEVIVKKHIDYEVVQTFQTNVRALNLLPQSNTALLKISVNNLPDTPPILNHIELKTKENTPEQTVIGTIPILYTDDMPIDSFTVTGYGKENFKVLNDGTVQVAQGADLDYEEHHFFLLEVQASNAIGIGAKVQLRIFLTDIGYAVDLSDTEFSIELNKEANKQIGTLQIIHNKEAPIEDIKLTGEYASMFESDATGAIFLKETYQIGIPLSFVLSANISNHYGVSDTKQVKISFFSQEPYIFETKTSIDENSPNGTFVGRVPVVTHGANPITSWKLTGNGSKNFTVDNDGTIYVAHNANLDYESHSSYSLNIQAENDFGISLTKKVLIDINNLIDPPTLYDTSIDVEEHRLINTFLGTLDFSTDVDCAISGFNVYKINDLNQPFESSISINSQGEIYSTKNNTFDYETRHYDFYNVDANTNCGQSNTVSLRINITDLDEKGVVVLNDELKLKNAYISIQKIEFDGDTTEIAHHNIYQQAFESHKYQLESDSFYIYEISGGAIYRNNIYEKDFEGKLRTIVKGSWLRQIEKLRITPVSEMLVAKLLKQKPILDPKTLESDLESLVLEYIHDDIDYNGEMNILDIIALDVSTTNAQYAIALDTSFYVRGDIFLPMSLGSFNIISINDGSLNTIELLGEGSEHFEINEHNELIMKSSIKEAYMRSYIFDILVTDMSEHKSIAKVSIIREPTLKLLSSYKTNTAIYKIASSKATETLYAAAGEEGVMVFTTQNQTLTPLTLYNAQTNDHIFALDSKIIAIATYLYNAQEILFALNQTTSTLEVIDVTLPESPLYLSSLALRDFSNIEADLVISEDQKHLYVAGSFIEKINIEDLTKPLSVSALNLIEEMPWGNLQFYIHEEENGTLAVKTLNEGYMTYFVDTKEELFFIKTGDYNKVEHTSYFKYLQKGELGYAPYWNNIVTLDLFRKTFFGNYKEINNLAWDDRFYIRLVDLTFSQDKAYLHVIDANGKIGLIGLILESF